MKRVLVGMRWIWIDISAGKGSGIMCIGYIWGYTGVRRLSLYLELHCTRYGMGS